MDDFSTIQCLQVEDNSGVFIFFLIPGNPGKVPEALNILLEPMLFLGGNQVIWVMARITNLSWSTCKGIYIYLYEIYEYESGWWFQT